MRHLVLLLLLASSVRLWSQGSALPALLSKDDLEKFERHALEVYEALGRSENDLKLSVRDERVLLHLPRRGLPYLSFLLREGAYQSQYIFASSEDTLHSTSKEEAIAEELLNRAFFSLAAGTRKASFQILKQLAPSPAAKSLEAEAKALWERSSVEKLSAPQEGDRLALFRDIRALFDRARDLPKMTPEEYARERAESAVLAPVEYLEKRFYHGLPVNGAKWADEALERHREWGREHYLLAYSECIDSSDFERFQMVINQKGGIFEANQIYSGSHNHPDSYESMLLEEDLGTLKDFLSKGMPPSDASGGEIHFIVSFWKEGRWETRTYGALSAGNPFQTILRRMVSQSGRQWLPEGAAPELFLRPEP